MIRAVQIARYRGVRELIVDGIARVNLIIGKNDCGKTAFMEAVRLAHDAEHAVGYLLRGQRERLGRTAAPPDFERFWQPMFFDLDAATGLSTSVARDDGAWKKLDVRRGVVSETIVEASDIRRVRDRDEHSYENDPGGAPLTWALDFRLTGYDGVQASQRVVGSPTQVAFPSLPGGRRETVWVNSSPTVGENEVRNISALKQRGMDRAVVELLREIDGRLSGIELLSPGGEVAELFVRLDNGTPLLPVTLMGDGFQHCLEIGTAAAANDASTLFIDEIENGVHHAVLEPLWRWIAGLSSRRDLQVFATTHSEECIQAACSAFRGLDDDGLRVIRLDRLETGTRATIYDRALLEVADRTGTEIRG